MIPKSAALAAALVLASCASGGESLIPSFPVGTTSTIEASPTDIKADGASTSTITVQLKDTDAISLREGGDIVDLATNIGFLSPVRDNNNGTYTATLRSTTSPGTARVSGSVNGSKITSGDAVVTFQP
ncbi:MAG: hypothetical protein HY560_02790 [Gemmatimonadetes bacterium]|nr:hypothetical protein [Gemmatimonadota bacterium]